MVYMLHKEWCASTCGAIVPLLVAPVGVCLAVVFVLYSHSNAANRCGGTGFYLVHRVVKENRLVDPGSVQGGHRPTSFTWGFNVEHARTVFRKTCGTEY